MGYSTLSKILTIISLLFFLAACESDDDGSPDSRVVISSGDTIIPLNDLQYQLPLVVQVANSNGSPVANTSVSFRLTTTNYFKGFYTHTDIDSPPDDTTDLWIKSANFGCPAEDSNDNGILDAGEDTNSNGLLDPETPTITSHPSETPTILGGTSTLITDENGFGYFSLSYPKTEASWVSVRITATAQDGLPENKDIEEFQLFVLLADLDPEDDPPAFASSPYGFTADCTSTQ